MSLITASTSAAARYASFLRNCRTGNLPPGYPCPEPPTTWPAENVALFERYIAWLVADGAGHTTIDQHYLPVAGHVLGYHLAPHEQLSPDPDFECVMAFLRAKQLSERSLDRAYHALRRFRRFIESERAGKQALTPKPTEVDGYQDGLPTWLVGHIKQLQQLRLAGWRSARRSQAIQSFWSSHTRIWRWLFGRYSIQDVWDVKPSYVVTFIDERLAAGANPSGVNHDLRAFRATLRFLQTTDQAVPQPLLDLPDVKEGSPLPRFLTDGQVNRLQHEFGRRVEQARTPSRRRDALLDRAAFYLLWQGGLRLGEVEDLLLGDINYDHRQLIVRQAKGGKSRTVYLVDTAMSALLAYLAVRGSGPTQHIFLYRHRPLARDLIRDRIKAAGERVGVKVTPHRLRHTYATQLLNAGCRITTIQALLGHKHLSTTMIYARIHDRTVADEYFAAMAAVEELLDSRPYPD